MNATIHRISGWLHRHRAKLVGSVALLLLCFSAGCLILPTPEMDSGETRTNISKETPVRFAPGKTTRAEVILALGEPDAITPDERKLVYRREKIVGVWFICGGYGGGTGGNIETDRYLMTEFDAVGVLTKAEFTRYRWGSRAPDKLLDVAAAEINQDASIRLQARGSWRAGVKNYKSPGDPRAAWVSGRLVLTDAELRFFSGSQLANEPAVFTMPYPQVKDVRLERFYFTKLLILDGRAGENHAFNVFGKANAANDTKTRREACDFIQQKINPSKP